MCLLLKLLQIFENLKSLKNHPKAKAKCLLSFCNIRNLSLYYRKNTTRWLKDINLTFTSQKKYIFATRKSNSYLLATDMLYIWSLKSYLFSSFPFSFSFLPFLVLFVFLLFLPFLSFFLLASILVLDEASWERQLERQKPPTITTTTTNRFRSKTQRSLRHEYTIHFCHRRSAKPTRS